MTGREWLKGFRAAVTLALALALVGAGAFIYRRYQEIVQERAVLRQIVERLSADSRIAEVVVTDVSVDPQTAQVMTTIKFLERDAAGTAMAPRYFTFSGNLIQFQSLVVRFNDDLVRSGDALRGRSAYLFWKAFVLDGPRTEEHLITPIGEVPEGYKLPGGRNPFEDRIWAEFWTHALDPQKAVTRGIKNAQIEAPGTRFVPGILYTLNIEHDGGIRIDAAPIPEILKGERVL